MSEMVVRLHECTRKSCMDLEILKGIFLDGSSVQECEVLDFKRQLPETDTDYLVVIKDLTAFHNSYGGFLVFGIGEVVKDRSVEVLGVISDELKISKLRDLARSYLGLDLRISVQYMEINAKNLVVVHVAKRNVGDNPVRFAKNGPHDSKNKPFFKKEDVVFRRIDSNDVAKTAEDFDFLFSERRPPSLELQVSDYISKDPLEHNLPDRSLVCSRFIGRKEDLGDLWAWLGDDFSRVRLIAGEGGLGKTSLAYHFAEEVASRCVHPFEKVVWLTAKERQFIPTDNSFREGRKTDFNDALSLFQTIASYHGVLDNELEGLELKGSMQKALESCSIIPSFIVIDDVDSLSPEDQQRALEFGMRTPPDTKMLLTTRVNFSYSPDNVLKLNGLKSEEFRDYVIGLRERYGLVALKENKFNHVREVTSGSPLFTDSLFRLERRGQKLDQAINQWKGQAGVEARKAALLREVQQLSRHATRVLYVICLQKNLSYAELAQITRYTEQTLGDALQELAGLFLISAPSIAKESRYTVDRNTGQLVMEVVLELGIDHAALLEATKRARSDAIGLSRQKRTSIVGLAISQSMAQLIEGDAKGALQTVRSAAKKLSSPNADLLLAIGRFNLRLETPNPAEASKAFSESYMLGQRKKLLFDLWFESECLRGDYEEAKEVATRAIDNEVGNEYQWLEKRAQTHVMLAKKSKSKLSNDSAIREINFAIEDLHKAKAKSNGSIQRRSMETLIQQADILKSKLEIGVLQ